MGGLTQPSLGLSIWIKTQVLHPGRSPDHHQSLAPISVHRSAGGCCIFRHQKSLCLSTPQPSVAGTRQHWYNRRTPPMVCQLLNQQISTCGPGRFLLQLSTCHFWCTSRLYSRPASVHHFHEFHLEASTFTRSQTCLVCR